MASKFGGDGEYNYNATAKAGEGSSQVSGLGSGLADGKSLDGGQKVDMERPDTGKEKKGLVNRAGESQSPYVSPSSLTFALYLVRGQRRS
jgi:hypothetical protein